MFEHIYCGNMGGLGAQSDPVGPTPGHYAYFRLFFFLRNVIPVVRVEIIYVEGSQ
jgi:hypothetical protein